MKRIGKWAGVGLLSLLALLGIAVGAMAAISVHRESTVYHVNVQAVPVPTDEASLAEGERLWITRGCGDCHGENGAGRVVMDDAPARIVSTNLTTETADWSIIDHVRAIRHGVTPEGRALMLMPSHEFWGMSDRDVGRIIAHYTRLPRVVNHLPTNEMRLVGRIIHVLDAMPIYPAEHIDHTAPRPRVVEPAETPEYGRYLAVNCTGCHGEHFSGGPIPGAPAELGVPANLTRHESGLGSWERDDFVAALRTGRRPDGRELNAEQMPWRTATRRMSDTEIHALWAYLATVPPRPFGGR